MSTQTVRRNISQKSELISDLQNNCINPDSRELYIHSMFEEDEAGVDFRMCNRFVKNLNFLFHLSKEKPILIHQICDGGAWYYGMAMYDAIKACPCPITILCYANAVSMSSIIMQAADYRVMMPHCTFMIHEGEDGYVGTPKGLITSAEEAKKIHKQMMDLYYERVKDGEKWKGKTENYIKKELQKKMDSKQEWYLTSREAVEYGFADAVLGDDGYEDVEVLLRGE